MSDSQEKIRAVLVDDEALARSHLRKLLSAHPDLEVVVECSNGFEAVKAVAENDADLLFLDIQMPKLSGFEVLELVEKPIAVVFVTAYDKYALQAFEAHAMDYLLKPFSAKRLGAALDKVRGNIGRNAPAVYRKMARAARPEEARLDRVVIKDGSKIVILLVDEIACFRAADDYVSVHSRGRSWLKLQTMAELEASLDPKKFVRVHRTAIVNVDFIDRLEAYTRDKYAVFLKDGSELPVSRRGQKLLRERLGC